MPLALNRIKLALDSKDPGNRYGKIHSHRFSAANTAVANANRDRTQLAETEKFLKSGFVTVDIFAVSPVDANSGVEMRRRASDPQQQLMSFNAVGEESEQTGQVFVREVGKVAAPIEKAGAIIQPGDRGCGEGRMSFGAGCMAGWGHDSTTGRHRRLE